MKSLQELRAFLPGAKQAGPQQCGCPCSKLRQRRHCSSTGASFPVYAGAQLSDCPCNPPFEMGIMKALQQPRAFLPNALQTVAQQLGSHATGELPHLMLAAWPFLKGWLSLSSFIKTVLGISLFLPCPGQSCLHGCFTISADLHQPQM